MDNDVSGRFMTEGSPIDANSEKELGNENFKQKKYQKAIDCYSRSIAFLPTAVAYANRAMAYLKLRSLVDACGEMAGELLVSRFGKEVLYKVATRSDDGILNDLGEKLHNLYAMKKAFRVIIFMPLLPDFQDITDEPVKWPELGRSTKQPFYSFLPPASVLNGLSAGTANSNGEQAEAFDLNLKPGQCFALSLHMSGA